MFIDSDRTLRSKKLHGANLNGGWCGLDSPSLVVVVWQAVKTHQAAEAARSSADTASKDLSLSARAWVSAHVEGHCFGVGDPLLVHICFENVGKTPARNVVTYQVAEILENHGQRVELNCPSTSRSPGLGILPPGGKTFRQGRPLAFPEGFSVRSSGLLDMELAEDLRRGRKIFITYGRVRYEDVFGVGHWTAYCYLFKVMSATASLPETYGWEAGKEGNDMDND